MEIDGYLIPLTGEYALGDITTIFIWMDGYRSGPYRNSKGPAELRRFVEGLGVELGPE